MMEQDLGMEEVECTEIVYRALKKGWTQDEPIPAEAFIRRIRQQGSEDAVSLARRKYVTARECRTRLNRMRGSASLHVGTIRNLPLGLDVIPNPIRDVNEMVAVPDHCLLVNLPDPIDDPERAERAASQLIKIARFVTTEQEEQEHSERNSRTN